MSRGRPRLAVVKLGGSHVSSGRLRAWLDAIAGLGGRVVVVPGGGPFADAVRQAQGAMGFGEEAAHLMAMLAMEQYGLALADLCPALVPARSLAAIRRAAAAGRVPVWCPLPMAASNCDLPASWEITSDSLALWLGQRLQAGMVVLAKSVVAPEVAEAAALARSGIVDQAFPDVLRRTGREAWLAGPDGHDTLAALVSGKPCAGTVRVRIGEP